jgi:hypothetical protein
MKSYNNAALPTSLKSGFMHYFYLKAERALTGSLQKQRSNFFSRPPNIVPLTTSHFHFLSLSLSLFLSSVSGSKENFADLKSIHAYRQKDARIKHIQKAFCMTWKERNNQDVILHMRACILLIVTNVWRTCTHKISFRL